MTKRPAPSPTTQHDRIDNLFSMPGARADRWRSLHAAAQEWARGRTNKAPVEEALGEIGAYEEFFAYPGARLISALRQRVATGEPEGVASLSRRISESILTRAYKHDTGAGKRRSNLPKTCLPDR